MVLAMQKITIGAFLTLIAVAVAGCFAPPQDFPAGSAAWKWVNPDLKYFDEIAANQVNHKVLVGVLDTGIDYNAVRLKKHIHLFNTPEKMGRPYGVGLDLLGKDYFPFYRIYDPGKQKDVTDDYLHLEHGTHVSKLTALNNPAIGLIPVRVIPVAETPADKAACAVDKQNCQIQLSLRQIELIAKGIAFTIVKGARVVNMSLGMAVDGFSAEIMERLVAKAQHALTDKMNGQWKNVLMVVAAGNESRFLAKASESIPATLDVNQMIAVGALKDRLTIAEYSNFGRYVDVYVRGSDIVSTVPNDMRDKMSGTSMATPLIAHLAAELLLINPRLTSGMIRAVILNTADARTLRIETEESQMAPQTAPMTRTVLVANFLKARRIVRYLISHPEEQTRWYTPPFVHGQSAN